MFCNLFGQSINMAKSKIIFSKNCSKDIRTATSNFFGMKSSESFGKYLRFPILDSSPKTKDFLFILDNMRNRLADWKINCLNMTARITLSSTTLASIPNYVMKYTLLPDKIHKIIDKLQRDFIWGSNDSKIKLHLLSWDTITLDKNKGGLGLRKAKSKNLALLTSLAWRLLNFPQAPWIKVLMQSYIFSSMKRQSFCWKSILKGWDYCNKGPM